VITADQLLCHAVGDYVLQSDWMANEKTKRSIAALAHVTTYCLPFLFLRPSIAALAVIVGTHFVIDRWRLARFICWGKNILLGPAWPWPSPGDPSRAWSNCNITGYPSERPAWLAVWLLIIADNVCHILINGAALRWL
jgi:Protein of unknown function (DUF3307)